MGLASSSPSTLARLSADKRFEVDGANIAIDFVKSSSSGPEQWDAFRVERLWTAINLHTTPSIARHAAPEVALTHMGIEADFAGPFRSPGTGNDELHPIKVEQYQAVSKLFPRGSFDREGVKSITCGLCQRKPNTTYDNFVSGFGREFGYNGKGMCQEEYNQA